MLVLSRKVGEKIHVGNDITVEVRRVSGNRVTLAIDAPRLVRILRGELKDKAAAEQPSEPELKHVHLDAEAASDSMTGA